MGISRNWVIWHAVIDDRTCIVCFELHGRIVPYMTHPSEHKEYHGNCRCELRDVHTLVAGEATDQGKDGADYWLVHERRLPNYYVNKEKAKRMGYSRKKNNLAEIVPGRMMGGDVYHNRDGKLPDAFGRVWYEADINYVNGRRNLERIVFSNDGLVFVTYDHNETFIEVVQ